MQAATTTITLPVRLRTLAAMATLLEKLERDPRTASAGQYRAVAQQVARLLAETPTDTFLDALLAAFPATAELYENLRYQHAGLCRSPLERALNAELAATAAIDGARRAG